MATLENKFFKCNVFEVKIHYYKEYGYKLEGIDYIEVIVSPKEYLRNKKLREFINIFNTNMTSYDFYTKSRMILKTDKEIFCKCLMFQYETKNGLVIKMVVK